MGVSVQSRTEAPLRSGTAARAGLLVLVSIVVIVLASVGGLVIGSRNIPVSTVLDAVLSYDAGNNEHLIVIESRLPRTILGLVVGAALGLAGALMQSITRNPLADPGLLGVNAGASAAVVIAIACLGVTSVGGYLWFALVGAAVASVGVYMLGSAHRSAATQRAWRLPVPLLRRRSRLSPAWFSSVTRPHSISSDFGQWVRCKAAAET